MAKYLDAVNPAHSEAKKLKLLRKKAVSVNQVMLDAPTLESFRKAVEDSIPVLQKLITKAPQVPMKAKRCKQRRRKPETPKTISDIKFLTLKDIVRFCHVTKPKSLVMAIMGKKYPSSQEEFNNIFTGVFRAEKRCLIKKDDI
jgi:hypothetical protein